MKKIAAIVCIALMYGATAQDNKDEVLGRNEVKLNATNLIGFQWMDLTYENLLHEDSSLGLAVLFYFGSEQNDYTDYREFSLTPFYRQYFSKGYAKGFFVEGFGMFNSGLYDDEENFFTSDEQRFYDFALGISVGGKFVNRRGFIAEIYGGLGRNLFGDNNSPELVGRGGISIGFRF